MGQILILWYLNVWLITHQSSFYMFQLCCFYKKTKLHWEILESKSSNFHQNENSHNFVVWWNRVIVCVPFREQNKTGINCISCLMSLHLIFAKYSVPECLWFTLLLQYFCPLKWLMVKWSQLFSNSSMYLKNKQIIYDFPQKPRQFISFQARSFLRTKTSLNFQVNEGGLSFELHMLFLDCSILFKWNWTQHFVFSEIILSSCKHSLLRNREEHLEMHSEESCGYTCNK